MFIELSPEVWIFGTKYPLGITALFTKLMYSAPYFLNE